MSPVKVCASCARRIGGAPYGGLLVALVLTAVLHLALLALFKPVPRTVQAVPREVRFTAAVSGSLLSSSDRWGLLHWMKYGDPTLFAKPDERYGFSSYRAIRRADSLFPADLPMDANDKFSGLNPGRFSMTPSAWSFLLPPPSNWLRFASLPSSPPPDAQPSVPQAQLPLWLDSSSRPFAKVQDHSGEIARLLKSLPPASLPDTVVAVRNLGPDIPPETMLVSSSGNRVLDSLAIRSLSISILSLPDALPPQGSSALFTAKWSDFKPAAVPEGGQR